MTEGGVASWKVKEGAAFSAGDVLLEIVSSLIKDFNQNLNRRAVRRVSHAQVILLDTGNRQGDDGRRGAGRWCHGQDHRELCATYTNAKGKAPLTRV